jgi:hypothetical protein
MFGKHAKNINFLRVPDKPTLQDLEAIGAGYEGEYDENNFGVLVLDECGTWFNSRNWQDKDRKGVNDWFLHSGKLGWDVYLIIQDISILDSQARDAICELLVTCRRLDKIRIPFVSPLVKMFTGINVTFPRIHRAKVTYADGLISDIWTYRGSDLYDCYNTRQMFRSTYPHGTYSILTPWHLHGRYAIPLTWSRFMRLTKIYWKRFSSPVAMATGLLLGVTFAMLFKAHEIEQRIVRYELQKHQSEAKSSQANSVNASSKSNSSVPGESTVNPEAAKISQFLASLHITGSATINRALSYTFNGATTDSYYSSRDLVAMGFTVTPLGDCSARIALNSVESTVRCF